MSSACTKQQHEVGNREVFIDKGGFRPHFSLTTAAISAVVILWSSFITYLIVYSVGIN